MTGETPEATVTAWAEGWRRLDATAIIDLFTPDATYVAALSGQVRDLRRGFRAAARTWAECRLEDLVITGESQRGDVARMAAAYRFTGITRRGREVAYAASANFGLRKVGGGWRIESFSEAFLPGSGPTMPGAPDTGSGGMDTL